MYVRKGCVHCGLVLISVRLCIAVLALLFQMAKGKLYHQEKYIKYCLWIFNFRFMNKEKTQTKTNTCQTSTIDLLLLGSVPFFCCCSYVNCMTAWLSNGGKISWEETCPSLPLGMLGTLEILLAWHLVSQVTTGPLLRWDRSFVFPWLQVVHVIM